MTTFIPLSSEIIELPTDIISVLWTFGAEFDSLVCFVRVQLGKSLSANHSTPARFQEIWLQTSM